MAWGAIGVGYKSKLIQMSGHVDSEEHLRAIAESQMVEWANHLYGKRWHFMQDGAPCHTSEATIRQLCSHMKLL
jgi:hypothetical protein